MKLDLANRLRNSVRAAIAAADIERADVLVYLGLLLLGAGLWKVSHACGLAVPGAILVLWALPPRPPYIERPRIPRGQGDVS